MAGDVWQCVILSNLLFLYELPVLRYIKQSYVYKNKNKSFVNLQKILKGLYHLGTYYHVFDINLVVLLKGPFRSYFQRNHK